MSNVKCLDASWSLGALLPESKAVSAKRKEVGAWQMAQRVMREEGWSGRIGKNSLRPLRETYYF
jgi:hypothetical protein